MLKINNLILASASERRQKLLHYITDDFTVVVSDSDESVESDRPDNLVMALAEMKAFAVFQKNRDACVIGADTVVCIDGVILGKPGGRDEAGKYLKMLQGRAHYVYTGVCVVMAGKKVTEYECTRVIFDSMTDAEIEEYLDAEDYLDKAGAYGIQGAAARYITKIDGCYYNVMGLPVNRLNRILHKIL